MTVDGAIRMDKKHYNDDPVTGLPTHEWTKPVNTFALGTSYRLSRIFTLTGRYAYVENDSRSLLCEPGHADHAIVPSR